MELCIQVCLCVVFLAYCLNVYVSQQLYFIEHLVGALLVGVTNQVDN